jgi:hypothetical protein
VDIEREEEAELRKNNILTLSSNNSSENNLSNDPSVNNISKSINNLKDSNNTSDSNSNYGENIIQEIKGPFSLNNDIITKLNDENLFISELENNIIPDYKIKKRHLKGRMDKSLPPILEKEDSLNEESSVLIQDENNHFLDKDKLDFINKYLENKSKYSLDKIYLLENNSEDLEQIEQ